MSDDPHDLARFLDAQERMVPIALAELGAGEKQSHWMWYVFPQLRGLGFSRMASLYGIAGLAEARAYLAHPVLGPRLGACTEAVLAHPDRSLAAIFGAPDDAKFRSSMTLFAEAAGHNGALFRHALATFCDGQPDPRTLALLARLP